MQESETMLFGPVPHPAGVLVVEDDDTLREVLVRLLKEEDYLVAQATGAKEALVFLTTTDTPHVILLDWQLPEMTGVELLTTLSHSYQAVASRHTYLLLTAWYEWLDAVLAAVTPVLRVTAMRKPFDLEVLLAWVAQAAGYLNYLTSRHEPSRAAGQAEP